MTMIPFNTKCFGQLYQEYQEYQQNPYSQLKLMSECYIEFGLLANGVELTRARVNMLVIATNTI